MRQPGATKPFLNGAFEAPQSMPLLGVVLAVCVAAAYAGSLHAPFVSDDFLGVVDNPAVAHPGSWVWLRPPPAASGLAWRPLATLLFALARAIGGPGPEALHGINVLLHLGSALLLQGVVRRTLVLPAFGARWRAEAPLVGFSVALLWALHPVQTQAVIWISQCTELLAGFFVLASVYAFLRSLEGRGGAWRALAIASAFLGTLSKESVAPLPVLLLIFDRTFVSGSLAAAWGARRGFYLGVASSWLSLAVIASGLASASVGVGFGQGVPYGQSILAACKAVTVYAGLGLWPSPLIFDRGTSVLGGPATTSACVLVIALFIGFTAWAWVRRPILGFFGASFLLLLAPSSGIVPLPLMPIAENRMHLALAVYLAALVMALRRWLLPQAAYGLCLLLATAGAMGTVIRSADYRSAVALAADTVAKCPGNARAHTTFAALLASGEGHREGAEAQYREALRLAPGDAMTHYDLANLLAGEPGREREAEGEYAEALRSRPDYAAAHDNLGLLLGREPGRTDEAIRHLRAALRLEPARAELHNNLANLLARSPGREAEAVAEYTLALTGSPDAFLVHYNLGNMLFRVPNEGERTVEAYRRATALKPDFVEAHYNLGVALSRLGRLAEAAGEFRTVLRLKPGLPEASQALEALSAQAR